MNLNKKTVSRLVFNWTKLWRVLFYLPLSFEWSVNFLLWLAYEKYMTFVKFMRWSLGTCQLAFDLKTLLPYLLLVFFVVLSMSLLFALVFWSSCITKTEIKDNSIMIFRFVNKTSPSRVTPVNPASLGHLNVTVRIDNSFYKGLRHFFVDEISSRFTG